MNPMDEGLFIVIPVHNRREFTRNCLLSLRQQTFRDFATVLVDDGSLDGTAGMLREEFPEVVVIPGDGNLWWSRATNTGVRYALENGAHYVLTLNNDTIAPLDFIEKLISASEQKPNALIGALAVDAHTGQVIYGGEIVSWKTCTFTNLADRLGSGDLHGLHQVTLLPGRGLLVPCDVFNRVGFFDAQRFPQGMADYDFTLRAARAGYGTLCNCDARLLIYPEESGDVRFRRTRSIRNYYSHLFGKKGGGNLGIFWKFAFRNCPRNVLVPFLVVGVLRRIVGYPCDWLREALASNNSGPTPSQRKRPSR
jgi:GT2 family glycosyltransferase